MAEKRRFEADHDEFWDLSDLVPRRKQTPSLGGSTSLSTVSRFFDSYKFNHLKICRLWVIIGA